MNGVRSFSPALYFAQIFILFSVLENEQGRTRGGGGGQNSGILSERIIWISPNIPLKMN